MTQQYIIGEFSALLGEVSRAQGESLRQEVKALQQRAELTPPRLLPPLAREALELTDAICWATLENGDSRRFCRCAQTAEALADFTIGAHLLP